MMSQHNSQRFDVQVNNHNTLLVFVFGVTKFKQNGRLDGTCTFC